MLQQTQVATVLAYYERFVARFPTCARSPPPSSARCSPPGAASATTAARATCIAARRSSSPSMAAQFPPTSAALAQLPGIGRSTAAAIAAFCFGERVAILDGNVKRVLARLLAFEGDLAEAGAERALWSAASALLPERDIDLVHAGPDGPRRDRLPGALAALPALPGAQLVCGGAGRHAGALSDQVAPARARPARQRLARAALERCDLARRARRQRRLGRALEPARIRFARRPRGKHRCAGRAAARRCRRSSTS